MPTIAYLEDETEIATATRDLLAQQGYEVTWFARGLDCAKAVTQGNFDLCLLDWVVPDMSGADVLTAIKLHLKAAAPPVIFLTGRDSEADMLQIFAAGADDYIVKPPHPALLLARLQAVLRRAGVTANASDAAQSWGDLSADFDRGTISLHGQPVSLGRHEAALAMLFLQNIGNLFSRERLIQNVFGLNEHVETRALDVHISTLRRKLELRPESGWRLVSVYGLGYRLERII
ncbi:MAG: response regulator transcription factor [Sulfuriferula sp.]|nr:response regulator transcription factor [Sulfuriferula sp.]